MSQNVIHESIMQVLDNDIAEAEYENATHTYVFHTKDKKQIVIYGEIMSSTSGPVKEEIESKLGIMLSVLRRLGSWTPGKDAVLPRIEGPGCPRMED